MKDDATKAFLYVYVGLKAVMIITGALMSYLQSPWWAVLVAMAFMF